MASGRLFQVRGPATANDLSPLCISITLAFTTFGYVTMKPDKVG